MSLPPYQRTAGVFTAATPPPVPNGAQPQPATWSAATRHLCAGAYLDADFRRASLREVYYQTRRMVAPSYGFDLGTVLLHCLRARNVTIVRDILLILVLLGTVAASPIVFVFTMALLWGAYMAAEAWKVMRDAARRFTAGEAVQPGAVMSRLGMLLVRYIISQIVFLIIALIVLGSTGGLGPTADSGNDDLTDLQVLGVAFVLLLLYGIPVMTNLYVQVQLSSLTPDGRFAVAPNAERFAEVNYQQRGNQVVYSGYWPFLGSGDLLNRWSFAQRLMRPGHPLNGHLTDAQREFATPPFTAQELLDAIRANLRPLAYESEPERLLPGLTVEDKVFVAGTEISHLSPQVPGERVAQVIRHPTAPERHYLVCQVVSWRGELVTTVYVHVAVQGKLLYLELISAGLPPCDPRFRIVDQVNGTGVPAYLRALWEAIIEAPRIAATAPANLFRSVFDMVSATLANAATPADRAVTRGYDHGARFSVRDLGRARDPRSHLQAQDIDKYAQVIERRVLAAVLDFLDSRGVDTTEFSERAVNILNAGAIHTGTGDINIGRSNVGNRTASAPAASGPRSGS